eukprot:5427131-Pyramimonas_sp.AAC.2
MAFDCMAIDCMAIDCMAFDCMAIDCMGMNNKLTLVRSKQSIQLVRSAPCCSCGPSAVVGSSPDGPSA